MIGLLLLRQPLGKSLLDRLADRSQWRLGVDRVTDQRDEVDDVFAVLARAAVDFVRSDRAERLPKPEQGLRLGLVDIKRFDQQAAGQCFGSLSGFGIKLGGATRASRVNLSIT